MCVCVYTYVVFNVYTYVDFNIYIYTPMYTSYPLSLLARMSILAVDKTGTLTEGSMYIYIWLYIYIYTHVCMHRNASPYSPECVFWPSTKRARSPREASDSTSCCSQTRAKTR